VTLDQLCRGPGASNNSQNGCSYDGTTKIGSTSFPYQAFVSNNDQSVFPLYWDLLDFPATTCTSVKVSFGIPNGGGNSGDTVYLSVANGATSRTASATYGKITTFSVPLTKIPWTVSNSATQQDDEIAMSMVATCSTSTGY